MLLIELAIAGSALDAGVKTYKKRHKKKKLIHFLQAGKKSKDDNEVIPLSAYGEMKATLQRIRFSLYNLQLGRVEHHPARNDCGVLLEGGCLSRNCLSCHHLPGPK